MFLATKSTNGHEKTEDKIKLTQVTQHHATSCFRVFSWISWPI